jgi:dolichyl-phosphate-mannose-protein mannosyltransferase
MIQSAANRLTSFGIAGLVVGVIAALKLLVHLYAGRHYGYFIDELYYLACADHLDWGYVDQPPLIALVAKAVRSLLGDSLPAIRLVPAAAGAGAVILTGLVARELKGGIFAQGLAALMVLLAPGILAIDHFLSMNCLEPLFWTGCAYVLIRIVKTGDQQLWIWFGILTGFGLENKYSMVFFVSGIVLGLLLGPERRVFRTPWIWIGALIAFLIFLPNLVWNVRHHFAFLELQANIRRSGRNVGLTPLAFFGQETLAMLPPGLPVWIFGLGYYLFDRKGRPYRALGWAWLFTAAVILAFNPRVYYLFPAFPILFAAGGVWWEAALTQSRWGWVKVAYPAIAVCVAIAVAPLVMPLLPVQDYVRYSAWMRFQQPKIENGGLGPLPQTFADQFGWPEMVATVAGVYNGLPPDVRRTTAIFAQNYGQAGAVDLFGGRYGLPKAISGHQSYFLWGPRDYTGESVIVMDGRQSLLETQFEHVEKVAHVYHPYSMPAEHFDVFYCRGLKQPLQELWPKLKKWN